MKRLRYETGIATLFQFIVLSLLAFANGTDSVVTTCVHTGSDCVSNLIVSLIFFILTAGWFGAVWILGAAAQGKRSKRLAKLLIGAELIVAVIALFNAKHHTDYLSLFTSIADFALSIWIITIAWRLNRAGEQRYSRGGRQRRRRPPSSQGV